MSILKRVSTAWAALRGKPPAEVKAVRSEMRSIKRELAAIKLDLGEARDALAACRRRLEDLESQTARDTDDTLDDLFRELAAPLSQLKMQAALMESGRDVPASGVMALARQVAEAANRAGLETISEFGAEISFDSRICEPLAADLSFDAGESVVVRFVGYKFKGRVIRKALVERLN